MAAAKTSRNVNKGFNGSKSKHLGIYAKTVVRVFILLGIYVSYHMIFQRKVPNTILGDGPVPRPRDWHLWGFYNFEDRLNCSGYLNDRTKPVPDMEYWESMLDAYNQVVDPAYKFDDEVPPTEGYRLNEDGLPPYYAKLSPGKGRGLFWESMLDAYNQVVDPAYKFDDEVPPTEGYRLNEDGLPPYYAKLSPGKGRGLFASRDIQKGEIVHDGTKSDVVFPNETSWKRFMFALPRKIACDQSEWTFTQQLEEDGPMRIVSSLNIAILMNQGNTLRDVNVQPEDGNGKPSEYSSLFRAMKDIKIDEEILMNYGAYDTDFAAAGLAELVLSNISCKSFETCSITEIWYLVKRAFLLGRQDPW
eukprot:CAMPEP_0201741814 /NCGR_PEP_ID=MMETSP0593-20130828/47002_1 /ASSEMBLY_ACC=CAM_ASM_000672 /TAXON_ID=267983 /ORGANISM="Skeletonema japonicum, Strain CCMP2506" /LENGTH=359 /DNA_ID=CAMNT_0048236153 /DNA_START=81 /DNA_END=1157 /DNA_ORIENTATION=-